MRLLKYQGLGNDFLISIDDPVDAGLARAACERHRGAGADGLIGVVPDGPGGRFRMVLFNADGSRAETSGNGLRCVARALAGAGLAPGPVVVIATDAGDRRAELLAGSSVRVDMGPVRVDGERADVGNPHRVVFVDDPAGLGRVDGPDRTDENVEYVVAGPAPGELTMRVWERGVGETRSCGSGACAAAAVARAKGLVGDRVTVHQPGGDLAVDLSGPTAVLTGPAEYVCEVVWPWP